MKNKTVQYTMCPCGKRGFEDEHLASKALGRARAKRNRLAEKTGTRRGMHVENRYYTCDFGTYHLTSESRRQYNSYALAAA